jgi:uncharacterized protein YdbL (DUF1318 family)
MDRGNTGISNEGLLVVRNTDGLDLKEKTAINVLSLRRTRIDALYEEIARANNFSPDRILDIRKIFAVSWTKNSRQGWWIQGADGNWKQK